ncbi:hypothetical protein [Granulicella sibirica]|uniref:PonA (PonA) n=1 Tax=Granulicella sibirica TaxID=2479048 RepID=A0A4Q0T3C9_9BACT|nr:hypothetical protein [Granulicella sibirica]RXH57412.1 ponA (ponA) [Granulicella sibirica]
MSAARVVKSQAADQRNKIIAGVAGGIVAIGLLYFELSDPNPPPVATAPPVVTSPSSPAPKAGATVSSPSGNVAGAAAHSVGTTSAALDPTLHMQAMLVTESVVYNGSGRNIFAGGKDAYYAAPVIPKPIAPARTSAAVGPIYTPPILPAGPPPINLKFFGTATSADGHRRAFLLHGDDVFLASDGDIVQRKYRVISVAEKSVQIEDLTNNNKQTLPLLANP